MSKIRLLLVDDHILMRMGLISATKVELDLEVVGEAEDGEEALAAYEKHRPDVVVLDLRMPKTDGIALMKQLQQRFGAVKILVLSNYSGGDDVMRAVQAGAAGYVVKGMPLDQLLQAIRTVYAGGEYIPQEIASRLARRVQSQLSERELEVLSCIARGKSNKEIAANLGIVEGTVKIHVTNILSKLGVVDRTQAVILAVQRHLLQLD